MGAWGYGLFESDHDLDTVWEIERLCKVDSLGNDIKARAKSDEELREKCTRPAYKGEPDDSDRIDFAMLACQCSTDAVIEIVRQHLDSGALAHAVDNYKGKSGFGPGGFFGPGSTEHYNYVLLGACAMTMGATLPESFKHGLKKHYKHVGLMPGGISQMKKALYGPDGYVDGTPYDFATLDTPLDAANAQSEEDSPATFMLGFKMLNVFPPAPKKHGKDVCGSCGDKEQDDGTALMKCGKCQQQNYCSHECQKQHWKVHKKVCKAA